MNLTPGQSKLSFALIALALAGLGVFLLLPPATHGGRTGKAGAGRVVTPPSQRAATGPPAAAVSGGAGTPVPAAPSPSASGAVDIFRLLPFSQAGLDQAVAVTRRFATDYSTYSYRQDAASYVAVMRDLVTAQLAATLARGYSTAGVARVRNRQKQVSSGTATVTRLRTFGRSSLTFLVTVVRKITEVQGTSQVTGTYAVTVTLVDGYWRVNDIELATAGNS